MNINGTWTRIRMEGHQATGPSYVIWRGGSSVLYSDTVPEIGEEHSWDHYYFEREVIARVVEMAHQAFPNARFFSETFTVTVSEVTESVIQ